MCHPVFFFKLVKHNDKCSQYKSNDYVDYSMSNPKQREVSFHSINHSVGVRLVFSQRHSGGELCRTKHGQSNLHCEQLPTLK